MKLFSPLYRRTMVWARHRHAPWYLGGMSFIESSFFPVPPDVMLAPMCLAQPHRAWHLALLTTLASVAGGLFGYAIGYFAIDALLPLSLIHIFPGSSNACPFSSVLSAQAWPGRLGPCFWGIST